MIHAKKRRPILLSGPYLAMWLWLIVPLTLHGLVPLGAVPRLHLTLHIGAWMEDVEGTDSLGEALRVMRQDRSYSQCRYVRVEPQRISLILLPAKNRHCAFLRLTRRDTGYVVRSATNAQIIDSLRGRKS